MLDLAFFLAFCLTLVALTALTFQNDTIAKEAISYLGEMTKHSLTTLAKGLDRFGTKNNSEQNGSQDN